VRLDRPVKLTGTVLAKPDRIAGGHVFFTLGYRRGIVRCAAFEPTGKFKEVAANLAAGDKVTVFGGVKRPNENMPPMINLEKLIVRYVVPETTLENPTCSRCGKHMKSAGGLQGFRCTRCHLTASKAMRREVRKERSLRPGLYLPDKKAQRHLTRPFTRYHIQNKRWNGAPPSGEWHRP